MSPANKYNDSGELIDDDSNLPVDSPNEDMDEREDPTSNAGVRRADRAAEQAERDTQNTGNRPYGNNPE